MLCDLLDILALNTVTQKLCFLGCDVFAGYVNVAQKELSHFSLIYGFLFSYGIIAQKVRGVGNGSWEIFPTPSLELIVYDFWVPSRFASGCILTAERLLLDNIP